MKINILSFLFSILLLSSCQFARFTARPGVLIKEYPKEMYGSYLSIEKHDGLKDTHRLVIGAQGAEMNDPAINAIINLADSNNSLSHLGDFYYLNVREGDSTDQTWYVYPFELHGNTLYIYKITITKKSLKRMKRAGLKPLNVLNNDIFIMENEAFKKYCEKYMKRKDAIKFIRIQL